MFAYSSLSIDDFVTHKALAHTWRKRHLSISYSVNFNLHYIGFQINMAIQDDSLFHYSSASFSTACRPCFHSANVSLFLEQLFSASTISEICYPSPLQGSPSQLWFYTVVLKQANSLFCAQAIHEAMHVCCHFTGNYTNNISHSVYMNLQNSQYLKICVFSH